MQINFRRVFSLVFILLPLFGMGLLSACTEVNITSPAPDNTASVDAAKTLVLPPFDLPEYVAAIYPGGSSMGVTLHFTASDSYNVCSQLKATYTGNSVQRLQLHCTRVVDERGYVSYWANVIVDLVSLGVSEVTITPVGNPSGKSTTRINVTEYAYPYPGCCKG